MRKAEVCDSIFDKFRGNKSINWEQIHDDSFYKDIDDNYYIVENMINFLISEGQLEKYYRSEIPSGHLIPIFVEYIRLTPKGIATLGDMENTGYIAKERLKKKEDFIYMVTYFGWIPILYSLVELLILLWKGISCVFHYGCHPGS